MSNNEYPTSTYYCCMQLTCIDFLLDRIISEKMFQYLRPCVQDDWLFYLLLLFFFPNRRTENNKIKNSYGRRFVVHFKERVSNFTCLYICVCWDRQPCVKNRLNSWRR